MLIKYSLLMRWLVAAFLLFSVVNMLPPGYPQPADALIVLAFLVHLGKKSVVTLVGGEKYYLYFIIYAFFVNVLWLLVLQAWGVMIAPLYYIYNLMALIVFRQSFLDRSNDRIVLLAVVAAMSIELFYAFLQKSMIRPVGTFDNPNGLAYFALCYTTVGLILADRMRVKLSYRIVILILGWGINLFALSKAGIIAMFFLTALILFYTRFKYAIPLIAGSVLFIFRFLNDRIALATMRLNAIGVDSDDNLAMRGYDRIWNEAQYLFFGAGEGVYTRHMSVWGGEIHSTYGTLLFCYGVVGLVLFGMFLIYLYEVNKINIFVYVLPIMLYSLTHNGLRNTSFWIVLGLMSAMGYERRIKK